MKHPILALLTASALLFAFAPAAEEKGKGGHSPEQMLTKLTTELSLTDEQKPKVKAILEEGAKKVAALKDISEDEKKKEMREILKDQSTKIKALLTPEQAKKYDAAVEKKKKGGDKAK